LNYYFSLDVRARHLLQAAAAFAIALVLLSAGIGAPFAKDQEPLSAQWVFDIVHNGHWLLPYDYYGSVERKPPLYYWLSSLGVEASGGTVDETLTRLPSLIAGAVVVSAVTLWTATTIGEPPGWLAMLFLLGMYGFASRAVLALTDMLMTALMLTAYFLLEPMLTGKVTLRRVIACGVILGLGILTKGPIVIVIVAAAACIYLLLLRSNPLRPLLRLWPWTVAAIALGIAAWWYVPAFIAGRGSDLTGVFVDENFGHFLPAAMGGTGEASRPLYYIALRLLGGTLPLSLLLPALIIALPRLPCPLRRDVSFQAALVLAILLIFSLASAKRDDYILPAIPPLATMIACLFSPAIRLPIPSMLWARRLRDAIAGTIAVATGLAALAAITLLPAGCHADLTVLKLQSIDASFAAIFISGVARLEAPLVGALAAVVIGACVCLTGLWRHRDWPIGAGLALIALAITLTWTGVLKPREAQSRSLAVFALQVRDRVGGAPLYLPWHDLEFAYYYGSGVPPLPRPIARNRASAPTPIYFVARPFQLAAIDPAVRQRLTPILQAAVAGGGGPPVLYLLNPLPGSRSH